MGITNAGLNAKRDALLTGSNVKITYVAIGTSATAPAATDTQLGAEVFRKAVTSAIAGGANGEALINMYLSPTDAVGTVIAEVGFFGGPTAGTGANTGTLFARFLYSHTHTASESIQFQLDSTGG